MYVSHVADDGREERLIDHLHEVAEMAGAFARSFGAGGWAYAAGNVHDIGKYSEGFQNRILRGGGKVDHSTAGAALLYRNNLPLLAYCVAGHHGGLPDGGTSIDTSDQSTLCGRVKRAEQGEIPDCSAYKRDVSFKMPEGPNIQPIAQTAEDYAFALSFLTHMVFSCLVDADYLCTERFMQGAERRLLSSESLADLRDRLEAQITHFYPPQTELNKTRCRVLDACKSASSCKPGFFSLTVPTGGGKTLASLRFALQHATTDGNEMTRVIYAVPYTSIIEQNAQTFRNELGERNVLEHHANFDFDYDEEKGDGCLSRVGEALRLASENWEAPVVVTTNVQFFESLYSNKTSRCRKLHNIANSVIVLDEAQMLPTKQLLPCLRALEELVTNYGCSVVLCTATQPALNELLAQKGFTVYEIAPDPQELFEKLQRVMFRFEGLLNDDEIARRIADCEQVLCIVNSRRQAKQIYDLLADEESFHLTTLMHPAHRECKLKEIRERLADGRPCKVVATSLIEAGVDVDFPVVYRALAGIDSMVQAAGRCNREGKHPPEQSIVHIFDPAMDYALPSDVNQKRAIARGVLRERGCLDNGNDTDGFCDVGSLEVIEAYFQNLYALRGGKLDATRVLYEAESFSLKSPNIPFRHISENFKMIEEGAHTVVIPDPKIAEDVRAVQNGFAGRYTMRKLSRYSVGVYDRDLKSLLRGGKVEELSEDLFVLVDSSCYEDKTGLNLAIEEGDGVFL